MRHDVIVVGGGMAGLTAAAYLLKAGLSVAVIEKEETCGGLVNSYERSGFTFDGGIRAIENSGIVIPMLGQLGIDLEFLPSAVSVGFGHDVLRLSSEESLEDYRQLLRRQFPGNTPDVDAIIAEIAKVMLYMDVLYGIDNPLFLDLKANPRYVYRTILPWMLKYMMTMPRVAKLGLPVDEYLARFTGNQALIDMIGQHFFKKTPTFFALSYFSLYLDYRYPKGGTGSLPGRLEAFVRDRGGEILTGTEAARVDASNKIVTDTKGTEYGYGALVWAADARRLYRDLDASGIRNRRTASRIAARAREVADRKGGDSIFTLNLALNLAPDYFSAISSAHFFYTPSLAGLSSLPPLDLAARPGKDELSAWTKAYLGRTTYEISCPALRDPSLAPPGKTGLIVSTLMDYGLVLRAREQGWYDEFKRSCATAIIEVLEGSVYPGLSAAVLDSFSSTPLTIERTTGNSDGAITGWAFTNPTMPAVHDLPKVARSVLTPIPDVYQAGQWSFSPSGLPISILTGKLAADAIVKRTGARRAAG